MQTIFKRHEIVIIKKDPNLEYVEYNPLYDDSDKKELKAGMKARINVLLPNGQYHVEILDDEGNIIAYVPMSEEDLEKIK